MCSVPHSKMYARERVELLCHHTIHLVFHNLFSYRKKKSFRKGFFNSGKQAHLCTASPGQCGFCQGAQPGPAFVSYVCCSQNQMASMRLALALALMARWTFTPAIFKPALAGGIAAVTAPLLRKADEEAFGRPWFVQLVNDACKLLWEMGSH